MPNLPEIEFEIFDPSTAMTEHGQAKFDEFLTLLQRNVNREENIRRLTELVASFCKKCPNRYKHIQGKCKFHTNDTFCAVEK